MSNLYKFLSLIIFIVAIWSVNSFLSTRVSNDLEILNKSKLELSLKQSFNDNSPADISKSMNEFVVKEFDKNQAINLIDSFAKFSGVQISTLDIQPNTQDSSISISESADIDIDSSADSTTIDSTVAQLNTLKKVNLSIEVTGTKPAIDSFVNQLSSSKQYIDIQNININFTSLGAGQSKDLNVTILAIIYYVKL
jgi:hypothetical protein